MVVPLALAESQFPALVVTGYGIGQFAGEAVTTKLPVLPTAASVAKVLGVNEYEQTANVALSAAELLGMLKLQVAADEQPSTFVDQPEKILPAPAVAITETGSPAARCEAPLMLVLPPASAVTVIV